MKYKRDDLTATILEIAQVPTEARYWIRDDLEGEGWWLMQDQDEQYMQEQLRRMADADGNR